MLVEQAFRAQLAGPNLLYDPSFEVPGVPNWVLQEGAVVSTDKAFEGSSSLKCSAAGVASPRAEQVVTVVPGDVLSMSSQVYTVTMPSGTSVIFQLFTDGPGGTYDHVDLASVVAGWRPLGIGGVVVPAAASHAKAVAMLSCGAGGGLAYFDDVRLCKANALTALVGQRIYYVEAPQDVAAPYIVIEKIDQVRADITAGKRYVDARFQVNIFAATYGAAKAIAAVIQTAMDKFNGAMGGVGGLVVVHCTYDNEVDLPFDEDLKLYGVAVDYIVHYALAIAN